MLKVALLHGATSLGGFLSLKLTLSHVMLIGQALKAADMCMLFVSRT